MGNTEVFHTYLAKTCLRFQNLQDSLLNLLLSDLATALPRTVFQQQQVQEGGQPSATGYHRGSLSRCVAGFFKYSMFQSSMGNECSFPESALATTFKLVARSPVSRGLLGRGLGPLLPC
jgi:hypothetical protein